jgi:diguanylate cyclase (GGDEF)-like protein/PAS domain S-box-containing protein
VTLAKRYFLLLLLSLAIALFAGAGAMRAVTDPILTSMQHSALKEQSQNFGLLIGNIVEVHQRELELLAGDTRILSAVIGESDDLSRVEDHINHYSEHVDYSRLNIVDIFNETILNYRRSDRHEQPADDRHMLDLATQLLSDPGGRPLVSHSQSERGVHFQIAVPILHNGSIEGALVGAFLSDIPLGTAHTDLAQSVSIVPSVVPEAKQDHNRVYAPINDTGLSVMVEPATDRLTAVRDDLILTVILAVFGVLLLPFGVLAYGGRQFIVLPTQRLIRSEKKLRASQKRLSEFMALVKTANDAIIVTDECGKILWINAAFSKLTGYSLDEVQGTKPGAVLQGMETDLAAVAKISEALATGRSVQTNICNYRKDGSSYWIDLNISPMWDETGQIYKFFAISRDITDQLERENQLVMAREAVEYQALHDPLTGLPNRRYIAGCCEENWFDGGIVIRVDLDHFKHVNDSHGHAAGDFVLQYVSDLLLSKMGPDDIVARVGGDEFIILLSGPSSHGAAEALCREVLEDLAHDIMVEDKQCRVSASFGIASVNDDLLDEKDVYSCADVALYLAKDSGRNAVVHYTKSVHADVLNSRTMAAELEQALETGAFVPFFQPQFSADQKQLTGVEVLLRWDHCRLGLLSPKRFLKLADQLSLTVKIERCLFDAAITALKRFEQQGIVVPKVSFNVSRERLIDPALVASLASSDLKATAFSLELLETFLIDDETDRISNILDTLRRGGTQFEVDHFGSGHASIIGLSRLLPDRMKIDSRLVRPIVDDETARKLVQSIIDMGRNLDIRITAVGVDTAEHAHLLAELGCDTLQGPYFSKSMSADAFSQYWRSQRIDESADCLTA